MAAGLPRCSAAVTSCTAVLGLLLLAVAVGSRPAAAVAGAIGALAAALAVVGMLRGDRFEARLTAAVLAAVSGLLAFVEMILGPPGASDEGVSARGLLVALASLATLVLLHRAERDRVPRPPSTRLYAR